MKASFSSSRTFKPINIALLTVSDTRDETTDKSIDNTETNVNSSEIPEEIVDNTNNTKENITIENN